MLDDLNMSVPVETEKLLRLLSQVILADGHVYETEIEALVKGAMTLGLKDETGVFLSSDTIRQWFENYLPELNKIWASKKKDVTITRLILSLADWPDKQAVVDTLEDISRADDNFHIEEQTLISIVKTYWQHDGLHAPGSTIIGS